MLPFFVLQLCSVQLTYRKSQATDFVVVSNLTDLKVKPWKHKTAQSHLLLGYSLKDCNQIFTCIMVRGGIAQTV